MPVAPSGIFRQCPDGLERGGFLHDNALWAGG
jgi:hypothetical protein